MALDALDRRTFVKGAAAVGGGVAMGGPLSALSTATAHGKPARRASGYGPLYPARDKATGQELIALPEGFQYRVVNRTHDPSIAYPTKGGPAQTVPTPTRFDGMGAFAGPDGSTILIRNHEIRGSGGRPVIVPPEDKYDTGSANTGGLTRLVVGPDRKLAGPPVHVLGGTSTNCAGGEMPWGTWITCEEPEVFAPNAQNTKRHGYCFEFPAAEEGPIRAVPIKAAGFFSHEAVAWHDNVLYETEDQRERSLFYRYRPQQQITGFGQLAESAGPLEALKVADETDADLLTVGETYPVTWVTIDDPDPATSANSTRNQGIAKGALRFDRLEGCWEAGGKIYFDATEGGSPDDEGSTPSRTESENGQLFEYDPAEETLKLVFASPDPLVLQMPDNLVVVPATGHVFLQEDSPGEQYVRGVTGDGAIYDFAKTLLNDSEFCGGCFSADGETFFLNQQGGDADTPDNSENGLTYAIWGPFARAR